MVHVEDIIDRETNFNEHSEEQIEEIALSIQQFGVADLIKIDEGGMILNGHATKLAFIKLGWEWLPCLRLKHLTEDQKEGVQIALNALPRWATPNPEKLKEAVQRLMTKQKDSGVEQPAVVGISAEKVKALVSKSDWHNPATMDKPPRGNTVGGVKDKDDAQATIRVTCASDQYDLVLEKIEVALEETNGVLIS